MLIDFPYEWREFFIDGKIRTFSVNTPIDIIEKAKRINEECLKYAGKEFFHFENSEPAQK